MLSATAPASRIERPDEMVDGDGAIRSHWRSLVGSLAALPADVQAERLQHAHLHLDDAGLNEAPPGRQAPPLDLIPLMLESGEWAALSSGIEQRLRLGQALLRDLLGPMETVRAGVLPGEVPYLSRLFHWPVRGTLGSRAPIMLSAFDLMRHESGEWVVIGERSDYPQGLGRALAIRKALARAVPEAFAACGSLGATPFMDELRRALLDARPVDNPRMAVLVSGPSDPLYGEGLYLARELGVALVQGGDLSLRLGHVALKALHGLDRIDVLLRQIGDETCDPLELWPDSLAGVPGLVQAVRDGAVSVVNPIGSGVISAPGLRPHLSTLCRALLGEELALKETEWRDVPGNDDAAWEGFSPHDIPMPLYPGPGVADVPRDEPREDLLWRRRPAGSDMPCWNERGWQPGPLVLRLFGLATDRGCFVLAGGIARAGNCLKDVWIPPTEPELVPWLERTTMPVALSRAPGTLQSRVAEALFWIGRYAERLDQAARLLRALLSRLTSQQPAAYEETALRQLAGAAEGLSVLKPGEAALPPNGRDQRHALLAACGEQTGAIQSAAEMLLRNAAGIRDRLSTDLWEALQQLGRGPATALARPDLGPVSAQVHLDALIQAGAAFAGVSAENMTRGPSWQLLDAGRRIERANSVAVLVRSLMGTSWREVDLSLRLLLEVGDARITYRLRYLTALQPAPVLDLVLLDEANPRGLAFQCDALRAHIDALPAAARSKAVERQADALETAMRGVHAVVRPDMVPAEEHIAPIVDAMTEVTAALARLSEALHNSAFAHLPLQFTHGISRR